MPSPIRDLLQQIARKEEEIRYFHQGAGYFIKGFEPPVLLGLLSELTALRNTYAEHPQTVRRVYALRSLSSE